MGNSKMTNFTLKKETVKKLDDYAKSLSINKSALVDRLLNIEIDSVNEKLNSKQVIDKK